MINRDFLTLALSGEECLIYKANYSNDELEQVRQFKQQAANSQFPAFVWVQEGKANIGDVAWIVSADDYGFLQLIAKFEITSFTQVSSVIGIVTGKVVQ